MKELALHLLDIAENGVAANASNISISVLEDTELDRLRMSVQDDGKGMDQDTVSRVIDPFVTSRTTRKVGLGIPLLKAAAESCNGGLQIASELGKGTRLEVDFQLNHIDRMPMGDLVATWMNLLIGYPEVHWTFSYTHDKRLFTFDDRSVKQELDGIPLSDPLVIGFLRETFKAGISGYQA